MSKGRHTSSPGTRRVALLALVGIVAAGAIAIQLSDSDDSGATTTAAVPLVSMAPADAEGVAFFCAAGTSQPGGADDETIIIENVAAEPARATITVDPGGDTAPVSQTVDVAGESQTRVPVSQILAVPDPGVTVEISGGEATVSHSIGTPAAATSPCSRGASAHWYLAAGTTVKGVEQWLALYNPFPTEAVLDITFFTEEGIKRPENLRGLTVPPRTRRSVAVHEEVRRLGLTGFEIQARVGRVVADRILRGDGSEAYQGTALSLATSELGREWVIADGMRRPDIEETLVVLNPSEEETRVEISTLLADPELTLEPVSTIVPPRTALPITLADGIPEGMSYAHVVRVLEGASVAVEQRVAFTSAPRALRTDPGIPAPATEWLVPMARVDATEARLIVVNTTDENATFDVDVVGGGRTVASANAQGVEVPAGRSVALAMSALDAGPEDGVIVRSDTALWVSQASESRSSVSAAVPFAR